MDEGEWNELLEGFKEEIKEGRTFEMTKEQLMQGMIVSLVLDMDRKSEIENASDHLLTVDKSELENTKKVDDEDLAKFKDKAAELRKLLNENPEIYNHLNDVQKNIADIVKGDNGEKK